MIPLLSNILETGQITRPDGETIRLHSNLPQFEGELLQQWMQTHGCSKVIEVGLAHGVSALFIAEVLARQTGSIHYIIDPNQYSEFDGMGIHHLTCAGYIEQTLFYPLGSEIALPQMHASGIRCDLAFIDGCHTIECVQNDFKFCDLMLEPGGLLIFDDVQLESVQRVIGQLTATNNYRRLHLPSSAKKSRTATVRRLAGIPSSRIVGFIKQA